MKTKARKANSFLLLVAGLIVVAGLFSGGHHALAQTPLDCPLPAGVTPAADPRVTAQQVEGGSGSLTDFALVARNQTRASGGMGTWPYFACLIRQEGSPWHSGSTYLIQLMFDGRVLVHAKDMSLSGRKLKLVIYRAILQAVGIDPAALTDRAAAQAAIRAAVSGDGGPFNVPDVSGASGYATVLSFDLLQIAGFDLSESHLVPISDEAIDYGHPTITAEQVVDRTTLKAFVTAAGEHTVELLESVGLDAFSKARIALRDPNGPWRHDPVYVAMMERASRHIIFHGAFPDRFELRQGGISRDVVTGDLIVDQLIAAAESGSEGGFWLYHFDNPADDTDSADIPKVGYARVFTAGIPLADGGTAPMDIIFNSGFYLTSDSVFVRRILGALDEGQTSIMFGMTAPEDGEVVEGDDVAVSVTGAPTDTVHFAYRLAGLADEAFTYLGAAANREGAASFAWDTLGLPDDDYELVALYTEDDGYSVTYDAIEVNIDNVGDGGGGCVAMPVLPGGRGPLDPTLPALVGLVLAYLMFRRRRPMRQAALG